MSMIFVDKFFPIWYLTTMAITQPVERFFKHHIQPQNILTDDYQNKSKFMTLDITNNAFTICLLIFFLQCRTQ